MIKFKKKTVATKQAKTGNETANEHRTKTEAVPPITDKSVQKSKDR